MTRSQRAAQKLLDYCRDNSAWSGRPSEHVIEALRILTGKPDPLAPPKKVAAEEVPNV